MEDAGSHQEFQLADTVQLPVCCLHGLVVAAGLFLVVVSFMLGTQKRSQTAYVRTAAVIRMFITWCRWLGDTSSADVQLTELPLAGDPSKRTTPKKKAPRRKKKAKKAAQGCAALVSQKALASQEAEDLELGREVECVVLTVDFSEEDEAHGPTDDSEPGADLAMDSAGGICGGGMPGPSSAQPKQDDLEAERDVQVCHSQGLSDAGSSHHYSRELLLLHRQLRQQILAGPPPGLEVVHSSSEVPPPVGTRRLQSCG